MIQLTKELVEERMKFLRQGVEKEHGEVEELFRLVYCDECKKMIDPAADSLDGWVTRGNYITGWVDLCGDCNAKRHGDV